MKKIDIYKIVIAVIFVILLALIVIPKQSTFENDSKYSIELYTVKNGDTLWSIGKDSIGEHGDIREWIYCVEKINGISSEIHPGEKINIYVYTRDN